MTLPVSLDVGTDNRQLLTDPLYLGYRARRLRGGAYQELVEAFVTGVQQVWPGCLIQWEDFKGPNALRILDHFRDEVPSFNDDVQGTAAVVLAGLYVAARATQRTLADMRFVLAGAGAAGVGIARLLHLALAEAGLDHDEAATRITLLDSQGLVHAGRTDIDEFKRAFATGGQVVRDLGFACDSESRPCLEEVVRAIRPDVLVGTTGQAGSFDEAVIRTMAGGVERPVVFAMSNPSSRVEASPSDILAWSDGRALVATGSPFPPVTRDGREHIVGQANNVFVFPGVGLAAVAAEARTITDRMFLVAAQTLASQVSDERLAAGALYPPVQSLADISRTVAEAVAREAVTSGVAGISARTDLATTVDEAMWHPDYVPYIRSRAVVHREEVHAAQDGPSADEVVALPS
jgi:malic enzyme